MELQQVGLNLTGQSRLRVWYPGLLGRLLRMGNSLPEAQCKAQQMGALIDQHLKRNLIVSAGKYLVGDLMTDTVSVGITYHAIGTGTTTPAGADTQLTTEVARKQFASRTRVANTVILSAFYTAAESTYNIKEAGSFGASAGATANSGTLFNHYLQSYDNSGGTYDLTFDIEITVG